jgi:hypothetical protein
MTRHEPGSIGNQVSRLNRWIGKNAGYHASLGHETPPTSRPTSPLPPLFPGQRADRPLDGDV